MPSKDQADFEDQEFHLLRRSMRQDSGPMFPYLWPIPTLWKEGRV